MVSLIETKEKEIQNIQKLLHPTKYFGG